MPRPVYRIMLGKTRRWHWMSESISFKCNAHSTRRITLISGLVFLCAYSNGRTQAIVSSTIADQLEPIVVNPATEQGTDNWPGLTGDVEHSEFSGSRSVITAEDIKREPHSLARLLSNEVGVQFRQSGGLGSFSTISVRAATGTQTNIYFDGVLLNGARFGGVDLSQYDTLNIGAIDIYRGATPVQLGGAAIGGAVNLKSPRAKDGAVNVLVGLGSFNQQRLQLSYSAKAQGWDVTSLVGLLQSDNTFEIRNEFGTPLNPDDDQFERRRNSDVSRSSLLLKAGKQSSEQLRYDGVLQLNERSQGIPHWRNLSDNQTRYDTDSLELQVNRRFSAPANKNWNQRIGVFLNTENERYDDSLSQIGLGAQLTEAETRTIGTRLYWERVGDSGTLALNTEYRFERLDNRDYLDNERSSAERSQLDAAVQYSLFLFDEQLLLTPAVRLQTIGDNYDGQLREGASDNDASSANFQLGLRWNQDDWAATFNAGQYSREPVFFELFGDRGSYIGNESLQQEKGFNVDAGFHWSPSTNGEGGSKLEGSVIAFASLRDDLIVSTFDARGTGRSENSGKAEITGLEATVNRQWNSRFNSTLSLTVQSAQNLSRSSGFTGKQLPGEAQVAGHLRMEYLKPPWGLWYDSVVLRDRFFDTANLLSAEDQWIHSVGLSHRLKNTKAVFQVNNVSDERAQDFNGFYKPGRSFDFSLTFTL